MIETQLVMQLLCSLQMQHGVLCILITVKQRNLDLILVVEVSCNLLFRTRSAQNGSALVSNVNGPHNLILGMNAHDIVQPKHDITVTQESHFCGSEK